MLTETGQTRAVRQAVQLQMVPLHVRMLSPVIMKNLKVLAASFATLSRVLVSGVLWLEQRLKAGSSLAAQCFVWR